MKGDFTRDTFNPTKHFSRVLMQQGRVTLDADANEQAAIERHYARQVTRDVVGPYAAPATGGGFVLQADPDGIFSISPGRYYVDGILVENDTDKCTYKAQPDFPLAKDDPLLTIRGDSNSPVFWVYLDVWEQHVTSLEDDSIREKALNGPDTCTRARIVWQVKAFQETQQLTTDLATTARTTKDALAKRYASRIALQKKFDAATDAEKAVLFPQLLAMDNDLNRANRLSQLPLDEKILGQLTGLSSATLAARVDPGLKIENACVTPPDSKYRGLENQLYRVEIHRGGTIGNNNPAPTFKWSRDNGSVATAWLGGSGNDLQVANTRGFAAGNWVELSDDSTELLGQPGAIFKLAKVEDGTLSADPAVPLPARSEYDKNPKVRRWDHGESVASSSGLIDGAVPIQEAAAGTSLWIDLEDGVQIQFTAGGSYRTGDYWLIPARVATGQIEWPATNDLNPQPLPPRGVQHHFAVLGYVGWPNNQLAIRNQRLVFWPLLTSVADSALVSADGHVIVQPFATPTAADTKLETAKPAPKPKRKPRAPTAAGASTGKPA
ncbi:MAG TPA: DUF6519 domain-containing protein [Lacunisphaera sp.]|jgi:hypothetical protein